MIADREAKMYGRAKLKRIAAAKREGRARAGGEGGGGGSGSGAETRRSAVDGGVLVPQEGGRLPVQLPAGSWPLIV